MNLIHTLALLLSLGTDLAHWSASATPLDCHYQDRAYGEEGEQTCPCGPILTAANGWYIACLDHRGMNNAGSTDPTEWAIQAGRGHQVRLLVFFQADGTWYALVNDESNNPRWYWEGPQATPGEALEATL